MRNYPINFVVKHPNLLERFSRRPALGRLKPDQRSCCWACFQIGVTHFRYGGDLETA
jgi:hypothetical protein